MEWITELNPFAQIIAVIGFFTVICIAVWHIGMLFRGQ